MNDEYMEKVKKAVMVVIGGETYALNMYCYKQERVSEVLNYDFSFKAFETDQGETLLINKDYISMVSEIH